MKKFLLYILSLTFLLLILASGQRTYAQQVNMDSLRAAQKVRLDSIKVAQKNRADSMALVRKYRESKRYKDSVEVVKKVKLEQMQAERNRVLDSVRTVRKLEQDSLTAIRVRASDSVRAINDAIRAENKRVLDSVRAERAIVSDSLAKIRAYKASKRYIDSMAVVKKQRLETMQAERTRVNDSVKLVRKMAMDSIMADRKRTTDSLRAIQIAYNDSLRADRIRTSDSLRVQLDAIRTETARVRDSSMAARKIISDSLAKVREARKLLNEEKIKKKERDKKLALEVKFENEKKAFTNEGKRKKKWTFNRRLLQNTFTRYNYVFNARLKMEEAEQNMQRANRDKYDTLLPLFVFNPDKDSTKMANDMDSIIHKASLGIQLHDPRSKWQDDLYLLLGQAYYFKGDYNNAAAAFKFIVHEAEQEKKRKAKKDRSKGKVDPKEIKVASFAEPIPDGFIASLKHRPAKNEAILWLTRVMVKQGESQKAQMLIDLLKNDKNYPKKLLPQLALEQANIALENNNKYDAVPALQHVVSAKSISKETRRRAAFIEGQILAQFGMYDSSSMAFKQVVALHPKLDMDFNARMNIIRNDIRSNNSSDKLLAGLRKMSKDTKFKPYYDQIFFALGKQYEIAHEDKKAFESYASSLKNAANNNVQKGETYAAIGDLYYQNGEYISATSNYDSATQFLTPLNEPTYSHALSRASMLFKIAEPYAAYKGSDSLLLLSSLNAEEQKDYVDKYLKRLEKQEIDAYYAGLNASIMPASNAMMNNNPNKAWYFANPTLMQKGSTEFKQKWNSRELKDNWRRSNLSGGDLGTPNSEAIAEQLSPEDEIRANLPKAEDLLAAIPKGSAIDSLVNVHKKALFNLGKSYFYDLEDYRNTKKYFGMVDSIYPQNDFGAEMNYIQYLIAMRQTEADTAKYYSNILFSKYPNSSWTQLLMVNANPTANNNQVSIASHYDDAYQTMMNFDYKNGLAKVEEAYTLYPNLGVYQKRYDILRAIGYAGIQNFPKADTLISAWMSKNRNDDLYPWAVAIKSYIQKNINVAPETVRSSNSSSQVDTNLMQQQSSASIDVFVLNKAAKHYAIMFVPLDGRMQALKAGISDYNRMSEDYSNVVVTLSSLNQNTGIVLAKEFKSANDAKVYLNKVKAVSDLYREYPNQAGIDFMIISVDNYGRLLGNKDLPTYKTFYNKNY